MKKLFLLTKTLLAAALLCVGQNAWGEAGDVTTNADIDFSNAIVDGVVAGTVNSMTIGSGAIARNGDTGWLSVYDATSTVTIPNAQRAGSKDQVNIKFKTAWGHKNNMGFGFNLKDAEGEPLAAFQFARWDDKATSSNTLNINMSGLVGGHYNNKPIAGRYTLFDVTVDYKARTITSVVYCNNNDGSGTTKTETFVATLTNTNPIATFNIFGYGVGDNTDRANIFDDLTIKTTEGDYSVDEYDYTVNWVCDEEIVKTAIRQGEADADIELSGTDDDPFWVSTKKYFYVSSDVAGKKVASDGSTVVTITVREAENWDYTINAVDGSSNFLKVITAGSVTEGESVTITYPQNVFVSNKLYDIALNGSNPRFKRTITPTGDDYVVNLAYSNGVVNNVTYYTEAEDITGVITGTNTNYASMDKYGYATDYKEVTTLPAGKYIAKARFDCGNSASERHYYLKVGDDVVMDGVCTTQTLQNYTTTEEFTVASPATLSFKANGGSATGVDWFYIQKTGEVATITPAGWASFSSSYPLDLSTITGGEAYYASAANGETVTLTPTTATVPAGEGLMIKGTPNATFTIDVAASGTAIEGNRLKATDGTEIAASPASGAGTYHYVFGYKTSDPTEYGFYNLASATSVEAGKAYLEITSNGARALRISLGDITEVENIEAEPEAKAQEGKFIENGKLVIIKNGVKYNAAGAKLY